MKIKGYSTSGSVSINDEEVILEGELPFMARMFSGKIEDMVRKQLDESLS